MQAVSSWKRMLLVDFGISFDNMFNLKLATSMSYHCTQCILT